MGKRLYRSRRDRWISGLMGGLGEYFGVNSGILRLLLVISFFFTGGTTLFIYFIAVLVVSKEPNPYDPYSGGWTGGGYQNYDPQNRNYNDVRDARFSGQPPYGNNAGNSFGTPPPQYSPGGPKTGFGTGEASNLDSMMEDIEKKAMKKELEELRKKVSDYEKGEV
ncbi:PspC domain-containing protein [Paenibacillus sanguinis]|uniref:PspC domain-containing protein n=1 Tax=Paenibacillus sanguinis TaxID=225906 RepID=UPI00037DBF4B|nr:PspC domain-containing protein [Paenibacillus sanguinis]